MEISSSMIQCHSIFAPGEGQIICLTPPCAGGGGGGLVALLRVGRLGRT